MHRLAEVWRRGGDGRSGSKTINESGHKTGGEAGIRTLDTAFRPYNGLANHRLRPLGHLTAARNLSIRQTLSYGNLLKSKLSLKLSLPALRIQSRRPTIAASKPLTRRQRFFRRQGCWQVIGRHRLARMSRRPHLWSVGRGGCE